MHSLMADGLENILRKSEVSFLIVKGIKNKWHRIPHWLEYTMNPSTTDCDVMCPSNAIFHIWCDLLNILSHRIGNANSLLAELFCWSEVADPSSWYIIPAFIMGRYCS